jgi:lysophospholipase L1-like esterase
MMKTRKLVFVLALFGCFGCAQNATDHWVATWAASPLLRAVPAAPPQQAAPAPAAPGAQQAAPARPVNPPINGFNNETIRMIARTSIGGNRVRVQLSNAFGTLPLAVGGARIGLRKEGSAIVPGSDHALTFSGKPTFTIPAGALAVSDAVNMAVPQLGDLAVSVYIPGETGALTMHATGLHTTYVGKGDLTGQPAIADPLTSQSWYFLSSVDVLAPAETGAIVTFGDSITDGARSTPDADRSWPSFFAQRVLSNGGLNLAVVNEGISGNRVLRDNAGPNALARFDRDVLSVSGVKWLTIMESINDIGQGARQNANPSDVVTADDLIAGLRQMVERAHIHGVKVIGCTLTPFQGAAYYSENGEVIRSAVNNWIRSSGAFDAVVDFDAATRDSENPKRFRADVDSGDHLHPGDAGYKVMAEAIDLSIFKKR